MRRLASLPAAGAPGLAPRLVPTNEACLFSLKRLLSDGNICTNMFALPEKELLFKNAARLSKYSQSQMKSRDWTCHCAENIFKKENNNLTIIK